MLDFTTCLGRSAARGVPLGEVLVEQGLVTPVELFKLLQQNLAKKLLDLFTWRDGEFHALPDSLHAESSLKVKVPQLVVTGITRFAPQEEVDAAVGPLVGKRLAHQLLRIGRTRGIEIDRSAFFFCRSISSCAAAYGRGGLTTARLRWKIRTG